MPSQAESPFAVKCEYPFVERIVVDPEILAGKPVIVGTRLAVEFILELLAAGQSEQDLLTNYPGLTHHDILASRTPHNLKPLVRAFVEASTAWAGHIRIIVTEGIQMLAARRG
ncbi:MAG: DUF433 domain-containing protein [Acidobacteriia bacterium]|nr:DUF433 domain-containing protein [Terriglobia bacterium]